ncbi:PspC domain-containing protein [Novosphingobium sp. BL-8H]|uniref:PspC domain-containing protein n=1 Tax=Novosphingobium sp. BL-8H TaxID=3127640 RepID=UPI0037578170
MSRGHFYLDKSNAKIKGVCAGIADYTGIDALWVRLAAVLLTFFGLAGFTIVAYILIAWLVDDKPMYLYSEEEEDRLLRRMEQRRVRHSRGLDRGLNLGGFGTDRRSSRLRSDISDIDRRVAEMEEHYRSSSTSRLAAEIDSLR